VLSEPQEPSQKIKVVDRRRFTDDGEVRPDREVVVRPEPAKPSLEAVPGNAARQAPERSAPPPASSQLFLELVGTLAQQAELLMTGAQGLPSQPAQAQRLIDYLGVLETKTRGNLTVDESQILSNVVFQLRALFVQKRR
jgi:hypothetical protein